MKTLEINNSLNIIEIPKMQHTKNKTMLLDKDILNKIQINKKGKSKLQIQSIDSKLNIIVSVNYALNQKRYKFVF